MNRSGIGVAVCLVVLAAYVGGCGLTRPELGAPFTDIMEVPPDVALVYVYRPKMDFSWAEVYDVRADGKSLSDISDGGYFAAYLKPKKTEFATSRALTGTSRCTTTLAAGRTYYFKVIPTRDGTTAMIGMVQPKIMVVPPQTGKQEIAACNRMPSD